MSTGALAIAFVGIVETLSIAKVIAYQTQQKIDYNRQIMAEGLANLTGGFFQSLPGSLSRSALNFQSGARTRFSGIVSAATVAAVVCIELRLKEPFTATPELAPRTDLYDLSDASDGQPVAAATLARSAIEAITPPSFRMSVPVR